MKRLGLLALIALAVPACTDADEGQDINDPDCVTDCWYDEEPLAPQGCLEDGLVLAGMVGDAEVDVAQMLDRRTYELREAPRHMAASSASASLYFEWPDLQTPRDTFEVTGRAELDGQSFCFAGELTLDEDGYDHFVVSELRRRDGETCTDEALGGELQGCSAVIARE